MAELNSFKKLLDDEHLPPEHREEVMKSIDQLKLIADMVDMFSVKQVKSRSSVLSNILNSNKPKKSIPPSAPEEDHSV